MKISYKHLSEYIKQKPDINDLSEKLFQLGHEHEIFEDIINLELTPNRGDCLSIKGLLRDLNLFYETDDYKELYEQDIDNLDFKFINNATDACPRISFFKIEVESIPSKYMNELNSYFSDLDIKKNNFFTDISNYISYETGQPTHCYEAEKIESGLKLDYLDEKQQFETLLGETIEINKGDLVFLNEKDEIVNLAGIMGGLSTSCNEKTKTVIVECAYFNPHKIMGKTVQYSINSDAAHKFERNVDPNCHEHVLKRFIGIIEQHTKIKNIQFFTNEYIKNEENIIKLDTMKINNILGTSIDEKDCKKYLRKLGFLIEDSLIKVPSHRHDIKNSNDIAEEVARAIGYNNIKPKKYKIISNKSQKSININEKKLSNLLISNGFYEVINDPFTQERDDNSIAIDNPLDSNRRFIRTSLKNSLLENLLYNERRQQDSIKLFEISDIYYLKNNEIKRYAGIIVSGRVDNNYLDFSKRLDDKFLQNFLKKYLNESAEYNCTKIPRDNLKSKSKNVIAYAEILLDESFNINYSDNANIINDLNFKYTPISDYPSSIRDLSFSITEFSKRDQLQEYLLNFNDSLLKDVFIFDYFYNEKKMEIKIGFRFIFQSTKSTITELEVNNVMNKIIDFTSSIDGVSIPGLK
tara:strand:+ start:5613 stop:7523 length:1911 start_codon:yes stop_codon:yes gene_type:complete